jgi:hypothetical protein
MNVPPQPFILNLAEKVETPTFLASQFRCPHCRVQARQQWNTGAMTVAGPNGAVHEPVPYLWITVCGACQRRSVWMGQDSRFSPNSAAPHLVFPANSTAPPPAADMPQDVKSTFLKAGDVFDRSPEAAAALLRLALQELLPHLGEKGEHINTEIGNLVRKGLQVEVQQALDIVRVVGNNAVHPGQIDLNDNRDIAVQLFGLLNLIVERTITQPKRVEQIYQTLPQSTLEGIEKRDGKYK